MKTTIKTLIVKARMWYADLRGHHGKRWNYEPSEWYMGKHNKTKKQKQDEEDVKIVKVVMGLIFLFGLIIATAYILNYFQGGM